MSKWVVCTNAKKVEHYLIEGHFYKVKELIHSRHMYDVFSPFGEDKRSGTWDKERFRTVPEKQEEIVELLYG